jgi:hypothetical protein
MGLLDPMADRIRRDLEPILALPDPRPKISSYDTMPYAIFHYDPAEEFDLRTQVGMLKTRLEQRGKRVTTISLAECLDVAMREVRPLDDWFQAERSVGTETVVDTVHEILSNEQRLERLVIERMPADPDPTRDVVFITRTGSLFPVYRTFTLLEQLHGQVTVPTVLFYPGDLESPAGLKFMGVLQAEHNYRSRIF